MSFVVPKVHDHSRRADVIIIGGGPSGLLLASKIGAELDVCLLERGEIGQTSKFWLTTSSRLAKNDLADAAQFRTTRATIGTFQGSFAYAEGDFTVVNESKLLHLLAQRCLDCGVRLIPRTKVLCAAPHNGQMSIDTIDGQYHTRLVIDASGGASPFATTYRLHHLEGFYSIYGGHLHNLRLVNTDVVGAHVIHLGHPIPLFEVIPTSQTSAFCVVFLASKNVLDPIQLSASFAEHIAHNPFFQSISPGCSPELKMGVIPIGRASSKIVPGILTAGEAGMLQSPLLGGALNEILENGQRIADYVISAFRNSRHGILRPKIHLPMQKLLNDKAQLLLVRPVLDGTLSSFERLVMFMKRLGPERAYRLLCTQLELRDTPAVLIAAMRF